MSDHQQRPNLPSVLNPSSSSSPQTNQQQQSQPNQQSQSSSSGIKLPPISFLSNLSSLPGSSGTPGPGVGTSGSSGPGTPGVPTGGIPRLLNSNQEQQNGPLSGSGSGSAPSFQSLLNSNDSNDNHARSNSGGNIPLIAKLNETSPVNRLKEPLIFSSKQSLSNVIDNTKPNQPQPQQSQPSQPSQQQQQQPSSAPPSSSNKSGLVIPQVKLKEEITKPDIEEESDEAIIKYYEDKYGINDFTDEEKHDILQHEKRARIEKAKNPNYKTYLCYSIIKRLNTVPKEKPKQKEEEAQQQQQQPSQPTQHPQEPESVKEHKPFVKNLLTVDNTDVLTYASKFPRTHIGSILYSSYPTIETHKQLSNFKQNDNLIPIDPTKKLPLLPELTEYINSIITVRIPSFYITDIQNNENFKNRAIWGTDIYTDDSDILLILKHCGWLPDHDEDTVKITPGNINNKSNVVQTVNNFTQFVNLIGGDVHVDLLILPKLNSYKGVYRNGINTRDWETRHDGVSIALYGIRYGEKGSSVDNVNFSGVKKRKLEQLQQINDGDVKDKFKINKKAWENAKIEIENEKNKKKNVVTV